MTAPVVALVGRPNSGKSSLFNALTGAHAKVGNFPGVTVEVLEADVTTPDGETLRCVDLPGVYTVEGEVDPETGFVVNLADVKRVAERELVDVIDHKNLNLDVPFMTGTIPTTENLVLACWRILAPAVAPARLAKLKLWETENQYVEYTGR